VEKTAVVAFPKSESTVGTDIPGEFVIGDEAAVGALKFFLFFVHYIFSFLLGTWPQSF